MRRLITLCLLSCAVMALAFAPSASAAVTVGISDQQAATFTNPLFKPLKLKVARYITPYDVMSDKAQRAQLDAWLKAARKAGQKTLVSFEHSRIAKGRKYAKAPSAAAYKKAITAVRKKYNRYISDVSPWNEVNACQAKGRMEGQPSKICHSKTGAKIVAGYYKVARKVFKGKRIVGLDILDGVNPGGAVGYIRRFKQYAKPLPKYWGVHNYSDTNRGSTSRTSRIIKAIGSRRAEIWLTETGGQLRLRGRDFGEKKAAKALKCMFYMPKKFKQVKRLYIYQFHGAAPEHNDFDAGLVAPDMTKRLGYTVVQKRQSAKCRP